MIRTPAHKQTNGSKLPGQVKLDPPAKAPGMTKDFDRHPYMKHSTADKTLGDYYKRKMDCPAVDDAAKAASARLAYWKNKQLSDLTELSEKLKDHPEVSGKYVPPKKLTFDEWWTVHSKFLNLFEKMNYQRCWNEAQKNV